MELSFELPNFLLSLLYDDEGILMMIIFFGIPIGGLFSIWFVFVWLNLLFKIFRLEKFSEKIESILYFTILITWFLSLPLYMIILSANLEKIYIILSWFAIFIVAFAFVANNIKAISKCIDAVMKISEAKS